MRYFLAGFPMGSPISLISNSLFLELELLLGECMGGGPTGTPVGVVAPPPPNLANRFLTLLAGVLVSSVGVVTPTL